MERFPTIDGDAVVADATLAATALNADSPGAAVTNEVWIDGPADMLARRLSEPPFNVLALTTRADLESELETDPLTRGALWTLIGAVAAGAFLALAGLALLLAADALGFVGGVVIAAALAALVVDMVAVTATRAAPEPPLLLSLDWTLIALSGVVYAVGAAALILLTTRAVPR